MIDNLKPYARYKASDTDWLGAVPESWAVLPNRAVFSEVNDRGYPDEPMLSVTISRGVVPQADLLMNSSKKDSSNEDKSNYKLVCPGDFAYNKMRAWQGAIGLSAHRGIVSPAYIVMRPRDPNAARYLDYLLRIPAFAKEAERWSYGITSDQWSLRAEHFRMIYVPIPPAHERDAIVRFLDYADRRIRRYIRAKQKLIKLLEEQKQAIIHQAVTRGLEPNVRLKPSGVEWLGDIPRDWDLERLKYVLREVDIRSDEGAEDLLRVSQYTGVTPRGTVGDSGAQDTRAASLVGYKHVRRNDVVINIMLAWNGSLGCSEYDGIVSPAYCVYRMRGDYNPWFLHYVLRSPVYRRRIKLASRGIVESRLRLYSDDLGQIEVPIPSREEQDKIVEAIRFGTQAIDGTSQRARQEIELLTEYLQRLISDTVTGKIDVRNVGYSANSDFVGTDSEIEFDVTLDDMSLDSFVEIDEGVEA